MKNSIKNIFSVILCAVMLFTFLPMTISAEDSQKTTIEAKFPDGIIKPDKYFDVILYFNNVKKLDASDCDVRFDDEYLEMMDMHGYLDLPALSSNCNYWGDGHGQFESLFENGSFSGSTEIVHMTFIAYSEGEYTINVNVNSWNGENKPENASFTFYVGDPDNKTSYKGLTYEIRDNGVVITDCREDLKGHVDIPSEIEGYPVTTISENAFNSCMQITSVTIPATVQKIEFNAFTIPFYNCTALEKITVDKNNKYYSSDERGVLFDKSKSELIRYPIGNTATEYTIPVGVELVTGYSFSNAKNLKNISIPDTVKTIEALAFLSTWKLESIVIPDSVKKLAGNAFSCSGIKSAVLPSGLTTIESRLFDCCTSLESIFIPASVTYVDMFAFAMCDKLKDIYYEGSQEDWKKVKVSETENSALINATVHYNSDTTVMYDVNGDGKVTAADARLALRASAKLQGLEGRYFYAADVNKDGKITSADARLILRKAAGLDKN